MGPLFDLHRVGYKQHPLIDIIKKAALLRVDERQVLIQSMESPAPFQPVQILGQMGDGSLILGPFQSLLQPSDFLGQLICRRGQNLHRRCNNGLLQLFGTALGLRIKGEKSIDLIVPHLHTGGRRRPWGVKITDAAADGKLANTVHLVGPHISSVYQGGGHLVQGDALSGTEPHCALPQKGRGDGIEHSGVGGG